MEIAMFEEFILSALSKQKVIVKSTLQGDVFPNRGYFDAYLPNGLLDITAQPSFLEIHATDKVDYFLSQIDGIREANIKESLIIICLASTRTLKRITCSSNVYILGRQFVSKLISKNPLEWWMFTASCSTESIATYRESDNSFYIKSPSLLSSSFKKSFTLKAEKIKEMSKISETLFKNAIKKRSDPALFIGNGASVCFGSDLWMPLCDYLFDYLQPKYIESIDKVKKAIGDSTFSLSSMSKFLIDETKYYSAIYTSIYRKYEEDMHNDGTLIRAAVKAKIHNPDMPILTYNYDNFYEIDYEIATGNKIQPIDNEKDDATTSEPKTLHVHGLFPHGGPLYKPSLVLTQEEYYSAYRDGTGWTPSAQRRLLTDNTCLFIGSSMSDLYQMSIIDEVRKEYYANLTDHLFEGSWKCFALLCLNSMKPRDIISIFNYYLNKGVYVIFVDEFRDLPKKLLTLFGIK